MLISLYTSRKILEMLGMEDFGIMNVVAGVVVMFSFFNSSMSVATQRFLTFELGRKDYEGYNRVFNISLIIHVILAAFILLAAETVGLWFVNAHLNIPSERLYAANWVYQATVLSAILGILQTPYNASVISHECMHVYAYVGLGETFAKLLIVLMLLVYPYDRLIIWGFAFFILQLAVAVIYRIYCIRQFEECQFRWLWDRQVFGSILRFTGWNMFGTVAWLFKEQGANILMNLFGGPIVNAARGVSSQVTGAVQNLTGGFQSAVNPQLTKNFAGNDSGATCSLLCKSSKISFYLLFVIALPLILEVDFVLAIWLVEVPPMTSLFTRIVIIEALISTFGSPMITALMATGEIKWYQIVVGTILLLNIPVAYLLLKSGCHIATPLVVSTIFMLLSNVARLIFCKKQIGLSFRQYGFSVLVPVFFVIVLSGVLPLYFHVMLSQGWNRLMLVVFISCMTVGISVYNVGLTSGERTLITSIVVSKIKGIIHINK